MVDFGCSDRLWAEDLTAVAEHTEAAPGRALPAIVRPSGLRYRAMRWTAFFLLSAALARADPFVVEMADPVEAPEWALLERELITVMDRAGVEFYDTYVDRNGELRWKERYEGGMNSSDDAYEGFRGFSLHAALGGSLELDRLHRKVWDGITRQFTRYGQIYREFDSNWDWMHHGEGYVSFYPLGLAKPGDEQFRDRSVRFARMYTGDDPEAPNYDKKLRIIRASMNGSRGPKMSWTKRDWIPTNANLVYYHLPYTDIPGVKSSTGWINDHPDNDQFGAIVRVMSERMARGDTAINLTATPLVVNAYLYTGDKRYADWVRDYVGAWVERTKANDGITPDNVGLSGEVGEYTGGNWWGGYYGWRWVRGGWDIVLASYTAAKAATLVTGGREWLELPRSQLTLLHEKGRKEGGAWKIPIRYDNDAGWHHYVPESPYMAVNLWAISQEERDWEIVEELLEASGGAGGNEDLAWAEFLAGRRDGFPAEAFRNDLRFIDHKMRLIRNEHGDPETWFDAKWMSTEPMPTDNLVRLTLGGPPVQKRGEMLHSFVRYFDASSGRPGLPADVAALVRRLADDGVEIELVNLNRFEERRVTVLTGAYGEHRLTSVDGEPASGDRFEVRLGPGAGGLVKVGLERWKNQPRYAVQ